MNISIKVNKENKYYRILALLKAIPPFNKLSNGPIKVFAEILTSYEKYANLPLEERHKLIFNKENYIRIAKKLGITLDNLYNQMVPLRKNNLLYHEEEEYDNNVSYIKKINPRYMIPSDLKEIKFNLNYEESI